MKDINVYFAFYKSIISCPEVEKQTARGVPQDAEEAQYQIPWIVSKLHFVVSLITELITPILFQQHKAK